MSKITWFLPNQGYQYYWILPIEQVRDWKEQEHPRGRGEKGGQFVNKGERGGGVITGAERKRIATTPPPSNAERIARAKASYNPANKAKHDYASKMEERIATVIKGDRTPDNMPFDVLLKGHGIEIKSIVAGKNDKITMHPESLERKVQYAKKNKVHSHTLVIDGREQPGNPKVYYREGVGSFRLSSMTPVSWDALKGLFK